MECWSIGKTDLCATDLRAPIKMQTDAEKNKIYFPSEFGIAPVLQYSSTPKARQIGLRRFNPSRI